MDSLYSATTATRDSSVVTQREWAESLKEPPRPPPPPTPPPLLKLVRASWAYPGAHQEIALEKRRPLCVCVERAQAPWAAEATAAAVNAPSHTLFMAPRVPMEKVSRI